jgi:paraquat-inducible protein B
METAISTITILPFTKSEQKTFVEKVVNEVLEGAIEPIKLAVYLKSIQETIKQIIQEESEKYGKKYELYGCEIQNSSRTALDYSGCQDQVYNDLVKQMDQLKEVIKAREAVIKSGIDPSTGEVFEPVKTSTSNFITIKFK